MVNSWSIRGQHLVNTWSAFGHMMCMCWLVLYGNASMLPHASVVERHLFFLRLWATGYVFHELRNLFKVALVSVIRLMPSS